VCTALGIAGARFSVCERPWLVPGRAAHVVWPGRSGDTVIGVLGQLAPSVAAAHGLPPGDEVYVAEIDLDAVAGVAVGGDVRVTPLPRHPSIVATSRC